MGKIGLKSEIRYTPTASLKKYLEEKIKVLKEGSSDRNLDRQKVAKLNRVFQSMADLIYFLEMIETHPVLQEFFEKDLEDLVDLRPYRIVKGLPANYATIHTGIALPQTNLNRLFFASLLPHQKDYKNFRLTQMVNLQVLILIVH